MGLGVLPWSPLAGGFLSGKYDQAQAAPKGTRLGEKQERLARFDNERSWRALRVAKEVAAELSSTPAAVSLAWLLSKPQVTSAIFGARSLSQLESNVQATDLALSAQQLERLDEASAPELGYPYGFMKDIQGRW